MRARWLPLLWLLLAFAVVAATFKSADHFAWSYDWRLFQTWLEAGRRSVLWYHQFPLWNPYYCGGAVHLANPQTFFLSLTLIPILLYGAPMGMRILVAASLVLAFDSTRKAKTGKTSASR